MWFTAVTVQRPEGTALGSIQVQVSEASTDEVLKHQALYDHRGVDLYKILTIDWPPTPLIRGDVLLDQRYTDPETGLAYKYRVTSRPKTYLNDHQECMAEAVIGG